MRGALNAARLHDEVVALPDRHQFALRADQVAELRQQPMRRSECPHGTRRVMGRVDADRDHPYVTPLLRAERPEDCVEVASEQRADVRTTRIEEGEEYDVPPQRRKA